MSTKSLFFLGMLLLALSTAGLIFASIQPAPLAPHQELTALMAGKASTPLTPCVPPPDWLPYSVKYGDTVYSLAKQTGVTEEEVLRANCLSTPNLSLDQKLYLPAKACIPTQPAGWGIYVVRVGDTLFSLVATRDTTVAEVKQANCLVSDSLQPSVRLYLPPLPPIVTPQAQPSLTPIAVLYPTYQSYQPPFYSLPPQPPVLQQGWLVLGTHVIQPGESLYCIGRAYTIDPRAIATMNGLSLNQVLVPGTVLRVPNVSWSNIPPGPVCQPQFSISVVILTPTPQASKPTASQPAATPTSTSPVGSVSALPASVPTPSPVLLRVKAEWPVKMWANESDFVRLSLIRGASPIVSATIEVAVHQTIVAPVATPIGTPNAPPAQALGPQYKVCAAAYLVGKAFEPKLTTLECQSLDRDELEWEWSVLTNQLGTQYLHFNVVLRWVQETTGTEIVQQIWHYSARVEIEQPWIVPGQLAALPVFGSIIGGSLTLPYLSERMKKRMNRQK